MMSAGWMFNKYARGATLHIGWLAASDALCHENPNRSFVVVRENGDVQAFTHPNSPTDAIAPRYECKRRNDGGSIVDIIGPVNVQ